MGGWIIWKYNQLSPQLGSVGAWAELGNKEGIWIGTPKTVERSINDVIPIGKAINESLLNLNSRETEVETKDEIQGNEENIVHEENINDETEELTGNENLNQNDDIESKEDYDLDDENDNHKANNQIPVRRSERIRKRLIDINPEDIGENDNAKDKNYKL